MNCFQNCIFTYDSQHISSQELDDYCCELLSELYFYLWFPTRNFFRWCKIMLWIAFRIVFLLMIPNKISETDSELVVVNCFQNCIFTYDSQQKYGLTPKTAGCELLSELYFYLWFPTGCMVDWSQRKLWIAFRIVFLLMIPNFFLEKSKSKPVVNCFQNCIFTYDSQQMINHLIDNLRCELLSELYFYLWFPTN